jgi:hypothetical protein
MGKAGGAGASVGSVGGRADPGVDAAVTEGAGAETEGAGAETEGAGAETDASTAGGAEGWGVGAGVLAIAIACGAGLSATAAWVGFGAVEWRCLTREVSAAAPRGL